MIERVSLNSLKFFYYVARYDSVTIAAEKLFVTQGAVSKQLKNLEEALERRLFIRDGKKLQLTGDGLTLFDCCEQVFPQIDQCLVQMAKEKKNEKKTLILSCEPTIAMKWLIPRLVQFKLRYPEIDISLLTAGGEADFKAQNIDLALRRNDFEWGKAIYSEKMADEYMVGVSRHNHLAPMSQLYISSSRPKIWTQFKDAYKTQFKHFQKVALEHFYLCIEASLAGLGATVVSAYMVEKELDFQMLDMLTPIVQDGSTYYLLSASPFEDDQHKVIFKGWLIEEMRASQTKLMALSAQKH
ncbi:LysR family transcriptional regulator [Acinetobacter johnsonii]|uniref:LysR family transcriptional regulator n=1 Tax=Acinetobacter johnsonii TaxID=40214 RepID=A0AA42U8B8_ACIJO|nr:LysR family transcriptional regulator [Acinetobacter johnsonii]MDH1439237.1 LysR family transcriptional regulator [Acinetobacter johnsonii]